MHPLEIEPDSFFRNVAVQPVPPDARPRSFRRIFKSLRNGSFAVCALPRTALKRIRIAAVFFIYPRVHPLQIEDGMPFLPGAKTSWT